MEAQSPTTHLHPYMGKDRSIKVDVVARQAVVSPIFRKQEVPPISERYVKVFDPLSIDLESQGDENYLIESKLYHQYGTLFNNISSEPLINHNNQSRESDDDSENSSSTCESKNCLKTTQKRKISDLNEPLENSFRHKKLKSEIFFSKPWISLLPSIVEVIYHLSSKKEELNDDTDKNTSFYTEDDELITNPYDSFTKTSGTFSDDNDLDNGSSIKQLNMGPISYKHVKNLTYALLTFVNNIDDWNHRVNEAMCRTGDSRITLSEAKSLLQEFRDSTSGTLTSNTSERLESEIETTEKYSISICEQLPGVFGGSEENTTNLEEVESFLKQGMNTTFITGEYLTLTQLFYNVSSLRHLILESLTQSDFEVCYSLIKESDKYSLKIPDLDRIKSQVNKSLWLNQAQKYTQKPVNYTVVAEFLENAPEDLKDNELYKHLSEKLQMTLEWIDKFSDPKFNRIILFETIKANRYSDKVKTEGDNFTNDSIKSETTKCANKQETISITKDKLSNVIDQKIKSLKAKLEEGSLVNEEKLTPEELELAYNSYQSLGLIIPNFRNIEPVYHIWKRFQRRMKRLELLISSESKVNCIMESLLLLEHSESVSEYIDIKSLLEPLRNDVEVSMNFERKCRNILNNYNSLSITSDIIKFKTEWNSLINFKKTTTVNSNDLTDIINMINLYGNLKNDVCDKGEKITMEETVKSSDMDLHLSNEELKDEYNSDELVESCQKDLYELSSVSDNNIGQEQNNNNHEKHGLNIDIGNSDISSLTSSFNGDADDNGNCVTDDDIEHALNNDERVQQSSENKLTVEDDGIRGSDGKEINKSLNDLVTTKIDFDDFVQLYEEFQALKVKNWQQFRNVEDIYKSGLELKQKANGVISDIKSGLRTDEVVSNLILIALEVIKYGANLNLEAELLKALKYCLWSKKLYGSLNKLYKLANIDSNVDEHNNDLYLSDDEEQAEVNLRNLKEYEVLLYKLASEPERESFEEFVNTKTTVENYLNMSPQKTQNTEKTGKICKDNNSDSSTSKNVSHENTHEFKTQKRSNRDPKGSKTHNKHQSFKTLVVSNRIFHLTELDIVNEFTLPPTR